MKNNEKKMTIFCKCLRMSEIIFVKKFVKIWNDENFYYNCGDKISSRSHSENNNSLERCLKKNV